MDGKLVALDLLKEWSNMLLLVQMSAIGFLGTVLPKVTDKTAKWLLSISMAAFLVSFIAGANLMGSLPMVAERIESVIYIYKEPGNFKITVETSASVQVAFFITGLVSFTIFAIKGAFPKQKPHKNMQVKGGT